MRRIKAIITELRKAPKLDAETKLVIDAVEDLVELLDRAVVALEKLAATK